MDAATHAQIQQRLNPVVEEIFDAYVIVGYHRQADGKRIRACIVNGGDDPALADAIKPWAVQGMMWQEMSRPQPTPQPKPEGTGSPE